MALSEDDKAELRAEAQRRKIDPDALIKAAEASPADDSDASPADEKSPDAGAEKPKLFQYHLPFVKVKEVRRFLGMTDPYPEADEKNAAEWAAQFGAPVKASGDGSQQ